MLFSDLYTSFIKPEKWLYTTWFKFLIRYRRTVLGPLWIIANPIMFIGFLGALFVGLSGFTTSKFIPHMTIGYISWTLIGGYLSRGSTLFKRNYAYLMQPNASHTDIVLIDNAELFVHFLHQSIIIVGVCIFYHTLSGYYSLTSLLGVLLVLINGIWLSIVCGIVGARYHDFGQVMSSVSRVAFLATPVIWMPSQDTSIARGGKAGVLQAYLDYNPFFHFLEIIRAPLSGMPISSLSWTVVITITIVGYIIAALMYWRYRHMVVLWV